MRDEKTGLHAAEREKLAYRSVRPRKGRPAVSAYKFCPECRRRVTMPCVACATRRYVANQKHLATMQAT